MGKAMNDIEQMKMIYEASKDVYDGKYSVQYALLSLKDKLSCTQSSLKMYFSIYSCMRKAKCYKMGTGEIFTKFFLNSIYKDFGEKAYVDALVAVKGNYAYRESVNNKQLSLLRACQDSIQELGLSIDFGKVPTADYSSKEKEEGMDISTESILKPATTGQLQFISNTQINTTEKKEVVDYPVSTEKEDMLELNIQPGASILNVFSRLSYKPWYAIAEFVDNSTQSYISHAEELDAEPDFEKLMVSVKYDSVENTLRIIDNAYGMEIERFSDAILLDSKNDSQTGRNEFGMGLKTAASWFGNVWSVTSTQYGSTNRYTATIDIPRLKEYSLNSVQIHRDYVVKGTHGTEILIEQITKKITGSRTIGKIRDLLSSMYRRDINNRNIEIWFNGEPIVFDEYPVLTNFRGKTWKKNINFDVEFGGKKYNVTGFVAIMNPGSFSKTGFALFRQDRVVVGGTDNNYKPSQIFVQAQSQKSLKLFGELNMNDFPVNQAKDGFIWDDGLEDAFIDALKSNIQEYIDIAEMSIKERATEEQYSEDASRELQRDVADAFENAFTEDSEDEQQEKKDIDTNQNNEDKSDIQEYIDSVLNSKSEEAVVGTERVYQIPINPILKVEFKVQWSIGNKDFWIEYTETKQDKFDVLINIDHPFFMPFSKDERFKRVLEKFTIAFILAERQAKMGAGRDGYIPSNAIKNCMNKYLQKLARD